MIVKAAPFYKNPVTNQIYEWTEKLAKVARGRGLVPYDPKDATVSQGLTIGSKKVEEPVYTLERKDPFKMTKVQLQIEAAKFNEKLNPRKKVSDLQKDVKEIQDRN